MIEEVKPQDIQDFLDDQVPQEERPDAILLGRVIEIVDNSVGPMDFEDVLCSDGEVIQVQGQNVTLESAWIDLKIADKDRRDLSVDFLFDVWIAPAAESFIQAVKLKGYNVCRPIGIKNPNLTAENGTLQLFKNGKTVSIYMAHRYHARSQAVPEAYTQVTLQMLVGKL
jgi:hypothetical protein